MFDIFAQYETPPFNLRSLFNFFSAETKPEVDPFKDFQLYKNDNLLILLIHADFLKEEHKAIFPDLNVLHAVKNNVDGVDEVFRYRHGIFISEDDGKTFIHFSGDFAGFECKQGALTKQLSLSSSSLLAYLNSENYSLMSLVFSNIEKKSLEDKDALSKFPKAIIFSEMEKDYFLEPQPVKKISVFPLNTSTQQQILTNMMHKQPIIVDYFCKIREESIILDERMFQSSHGISP